MKFGVCEQLLDSRLGPMALADTAYRTAQLAGADSFWVPDHLNNLVPQSLMSTKYSGAARLVPNVDASLEPWAALGYLAGRHRYKRPRLGTAVTDAGRRNPAVTAQAAASLHLITRGRTILGIGTGEREGNEPYGVDWSKPVARFEEAVATIRALWNSGGELVDRESEWFPLRNASFRLPPYKGTWPDIWIASHGPRMLRATGRYADGWFPVGVFEPRQYAEGLREVRTAADDANRDPLSITAANTHFVVTGRSSDEVDEALNSVLIRVFALNIPAWAWAEHGVQHPLGADFAGFQDILPQTFSEQAALDFATAVPPSLLRRYLLTGTPDEVVDQLAAWRDHGVQHPVFVNVSVLQTKLRRGLQAALPFVKILRRIRHM